MTQTFNEEVVFNDPVTANDNVTIQGDNGRIHVGDNLGFVTDESYVEIYRDDILPATKPKRGFHTLGRIGGVISDAIAWMVSELELPGTQAITGIHAALRSRLTHTNTGDSSGAEIQAGAFEVVNASGTSGTPVGQTTAIEAKISNESTGYLSNAVGIDVSIANENVNASPITNAYGLRISDIDEADNNFALHTGKGTVHLGDEMELPIFSTPPSDNPPTGYLKVYPKVDGIPKLYAKDDQGVEHILGGGGGVGDTIDDLTVNNSLTYASGASDGRVLVSDANGGASWQDAVPTIITENDAYQQDVLAEVNLTATAPNITFPSIPQDYDHLILIGEVRSTHLTGPNMYYSLNGDAVDTNYKTSIFYLGGNSGNGNFGHNHYASATSRRLLSWIPGADSATNTFAYFRAEIPAYTNTSRNKRFSCEVDTVTGSSNENQYVVKNIGRWISTNNITQVQFTFDNGSFEIGSWVKLIGVKKRDVVTSVSGPIFGTGIAPTPANALIGEIRMTAANTPPSGWLVCDGSAVSRSTYSDLFNSISTTYGIGDGSTTFNLPDLRGRVPLGAGQGSGLTNRTMGQELGQENHQLTVNEMPSHSHQYNNPVAGAQGATWAWVANYKVGLLNSTSVGGDLPHNNIQPSVVVNYIIKH